MRCSKNHFYNSTGNNWDEKYERIRNNGLVQIAITLYCSEKMQMFRFNSK